MRFFILVFILGTFVSCGTVGGTLRGMGSDLDLVGSYLFEG